MFKHFQVAMMVLNAFAISDHIHKNNTLGLTFSSIGFCCFALLYVGTAIKEYNKEN